MRFGLLRMIGEHGLTLYRSRVVFFGDSGIQGKTSAAEEKALMCEAGQHRAGESRNWQKKTSCAKGCGALQAKQRSIASVPAEC